MKIKISKVSPKNNGYCSIEPIEMSLGVNELAKNETLIVLAPQSLILISPYLWSLLFELMQL